MRRLVTQHLSTFVIKLVYTVILSHLLKFTVLPFWHVRLRVLCFKFSNVSFMNGCPKERDACPEIKYNVCLLAVHSLPQVELIRRKEDRSLLLIQGINNIMDSFENFTDSP
jgi:hypothetical protein